MAGREPVSERGQFGFDVGEGGFEGAAANGIRGALIEDAFTLELEGHALAQAVGLGGSVLFVRGGRGGRLAL